VKRTNHWHPRLLRARRERLRHRRAAETGHKLPSTDLDCHSIRPQWDRACCIVALWETHHAPIGRSVTDFTMFNGEKTRCFSVVRNVLHGPKRRFTAMRSCNTSRHGTDIVSVPLQPRHASLNGGEPRSSSGSLAMLTAIRQDLPPTLLYATKAINIR
jgi:hypothetical protein